MTVSPLIWGVTIAVILALLAFDYFFHIRKAHIPTLKEAAVWSSIYVGLAVIFGVIVFLFSGPTDGAEYFAGYITEKALSVDNLFVFLIIMASFRVPREDQQKVLLFGIVFALIARTGFIFLGAALINSFSWVFYIFGLILLITAGNLLKPEGEGDDDEANNFIIRLAKKVLPTTDHYDGDKLFTLENGKKVLTPMLLVMVAIGGTDLLFALDSIPAIFGLTQSTFIVFTATAFSLMGLRQLYFLIDGLLDRLIYLSYGLAAILAFIGVKLVLHALHENTLPFINGGEHVPVVEISTGLSLSVILGVLVITVIASLVSPAGKATAAVNNARRHAAAYQDLTYTSDPAERERVYTALCEEEKVIFTMDKKYRDKVKDIEAIRAEVAHAHEMHAKYINS
ncbi:TerC family protein [Arthrobacter sp. zg-ZUI100]|uniref:TerC family protein n=1 Tax=Arthrobacter jiangjiafuii TaxID=2817475 RepID=A0A975M475_9MICC|nr:TerC family protein [Arthrobacter jiangjiafuii]MBP3035113.1 TerC family protein [Arthrobacter jiangjiafuii]MBP3042695.1 TerC family protein [Arthrobacter jiangjiafuii]QWC09585.1 TerC family protein [Arthrobacter jiangjiafuii]